VRVLTFLSDRSSTSLGDVARAVGASPPSASRLCQRLVRDGLVRRAVAGGRLLAFDLTDEGRLALDRVNAARLADLTRIRARLATDDRAAFDRGLAAFARAAARNEDY